jgi:hypothetical protein
VAGIVLTLPAENKWLTAAVCCWSLPLLNGFVMGQDVAIAVLALAVSLALLFRGRDFAAGCVLSLCLIKFHLFLAFPIFIVARRMWRYGLGAAVGCVTLLAISFAVSGWRWPAAYLDVLRFPATTALFSGLPNLRGLFSSLSAVNLWQGIGTAVVAVLTWIAARRGELRLAIAAVIICGLLVSHHAFCADAFVIVPAAVLLWEGAVTTLQKTAALVLMCPLIYVGLVAPPPLIHPAIFFLIAMTVIVWQGPAKRALKTEN